MNDAVQIRRCSAALRGAPLQKSTVADPSPRTRDPRPAKKGKPMQEEHAPLTPDRFNPQVHARKCTICNHPERDEIEDDFVYWGHPATIVKKYGLTHRSNLFR